MRQFLAIEPDARARSGIDDAIAGARAMANADGLRWTPSENVHLTLHFLGEVAPERARELADSLDTPFRIEPFLVTLDRFGVFPPSGPPRTVWLGVGQGAASVEHVHQELGRRLTSLGVAIETRRFTPHLTVARAKDGDHRLRRLRELLAEVRVPAVQWTVNEAVLVRSDLSGPRPIYTAVARMKLDARGTD